MSDSTSLAIRSISWRGVGSVVQFVLGVALTLVLMRLISPDEYGVVAKVYIVLSFFSVFLDFGFSLGIIQSKEKSVAFLSSHFYMSLAIGITLAIILALSASSIAQFYKVPQLQSILYVIALNLIIGGISIVHRAYMTKLMKFKLLSIINITAFVISGIVALLLAQMSYGYYAIIAQIVSLNIIQAILLWRYSGFKLSREFDLSHIKKTFRFSSYIFMTQIINYVSEILDQFLSSIYFSQSTLGKYNRSISLARTPVKIVPQTFSSVLLPLFAHSLNEKKIDRNESIYVRSSCLIFHTIAPLLLIIFVFAENITTILLSPEWYDIFQYIRILSLASLLMILNLEGPLFLSKGKSKEISRVVFINKIIRILIICITIQYSFKSMLYGLVAAEIVMKIINLIAARYYLSLDLKTYFSKISIPLISVSIFFLCLIALKRHILTPGYYFIFATTLLYALYIFISYRLQVGQAGKDLGVIVAEVRR